MDDPVLIETEARSPVRPEVRRIVALIVIGAATAQALGFTLRMNTQIGANDISRWCTVWSLLERGTYVIDDCPWQSKTIDKVLWERPGQDVSEGSEPEKHYYSSKPPLLPTLIAGVLYPIRAAVGVPIDRAVEEERNPRYVPKLPDEEAVDSRAASPEGPEIPEYELETPKPLEWQTYIFYFKPVVVLLNVIPMLVFLILFARLLDRYAADDWSWFPSLFAAAFGTHLLAFDQTLNNHTIAAYSAFFALYPLLRIWSGGDGSASPWLFAAAGFFGAFTACNELPAALFGILLFGMLLVRFPRSTLLYFVPAAAIPCIAFLATQYLAFGRIEPVYSEFGTETYNYEGSYWNTPLEFDYFNKHPEPKPVYLFHMILGHHGIASLTPIFLYSAWGIVVTLWHRGRDRGLSALAWLTAVLTVAVIASYLFNPKASNYGGSTQGLRWLFWLYPFWLVMLPAGIDAFRTKSWCRRLALGALFVSVFSVAYAVRSPWSHPWIVDMLEHLDLYKLKH